MRTETAHRDACRQVPGDKRLYALVAWKETSLRRVVSVTYAQWCLQIDKDMRGITGPSYSNEPLPFYLCGVIGFHSI